MSLLSTVSMHKQLQVVTENAVRRSNVGVHCDLMKLLSCSSLELEARDDSDSKSNCLLQQSSPSFCQIVGTLQKWTSYPKTRPRGPDELMARLNGYMILSGWDTSTKYTTSSI